MNARATPAESPIVLGFEVGTGTQVDIPTSHMAVTGQTQQSGKTTTLEALVARSGMTALTFVTKRGEQSFQGGNRVQPYFRDRADWQFVDSLLEAALGEKNKYLRQFLIPICRSTNTLADVQREVRGGLKKAHGAKEGALIQLDAYLDLIVPEIAAADLAPTLDLAGGINVMDVSGFSTAMQMLFVQSALDWVNDRCRDTLVVIPEAWEFIPEGKGSPVKGSAVALARKGAALRNFIWVDSQDMAGVDKTILRACTVWLIGVQREANEIKRALQNIPAGIKKPSAADVALLERGQFFACWGRHCVKVYVQPAWMSEQSAIEVARGTAIGDSVKAAGAPRHTPPQEEPTVTPDEADTLRKRNADLETMVKNQQNQIDDLKKIVEAARAAASPASLAWRLRPGAIGAEASQQITAAPPPPGTRQLISDRLLIDDPGQISDFLLDALLGRMVKRAAETPSILSLLKIVPEIELRVEQRTVQIDGSNTEGRIVGMLAAGFFDAGSTNNAVRQEFKRTGPDSNNANIGRVLDKLVSWGFMTLEEGKLYKAVSTMKTSIRKSA